MRHVFVDEGTEEDRERFENIEELASVATRHDNLPGQEGIALFLPRLHSQAIKMNSIREKTGVIL